MLHIHQQNDAIHLILRWILIILYVKCFKEQFVPLVSNVNPVCCQVLTSQLGSYSLYSKVQQMQADSSHKRMAEKDSFHVWVFCTHWSFKTSLCHDAMADCWKLYSKDVLYIQRRLATWITTVLFSRLTGLLCSHRVIPHWLRLLRSTVTSKPSVGAYVCACACVAKHNFYRKLSSFPVFKVELKLKVNHQKEEICWFFLAYTF